MPNPFPGDPADARASRVAGGETRFFLPLAPIDAPEVGKDVRCWGRLRAREFHGRDPDAIRLEVNRYDRSNLARVRAHAIAKLHGFGGHLVS